MINKYRVKKNHMITKVLFIITGTDKRNGEDFENEVSYNFSIEEGGDYGKLPSYDDRLSKKCERVVDDLEKAFKADATNISIIYKIQ